MIIETKTMSTWKDRSHEVGKNVLHPEVKGEERIFDMISGTKVHPMIKLRAIIIFMIMILPVFMDAGKLDIKGKPLQIESSFVISINGQEVKINEDQTFNESFLENLNAYEPVIIATGGTPLESFDCTLQFMFNSEMNLICTPKDYTNIRTTYEMSDNKYVQSQACSALLDFYFENEMNFGDFGNKNQTFDETWAFFRANFSVPEFPTSDDVKTLLMKQCFPKEITLEEKELRLNILLSFRYYDHLFFSNHMDMLFNMAYKCIEQQAKQEESIKIANGVEIARAAMIYYDYTQSASFYLYPPQVLQLQPKNFKILRIVFLLKSKNENTYSFHWNHNTFMRIPGIASIYKHNEYDDYVRGTFDLHKVDYSLFSNKDSMNIFLWP